MTTLTTYSNPGSANSQPLFPDIKLTAINLNKVFSIIQQLTPLTLPYRDANGRVIQIWKLRQQELIGAVLTRKGELKLIPGNKIHNPLNPKDNWKDLIRRLESVEIRSWGLVFDEQQSALTIWPELKAAGGIQYYNYKKMTFQQYFQNMKERLVNLNEFGALNWRHYSDYRKEVKEQPIVGKDGKPLFNHKKNRAYDHIREVRDNQTHAKRLIEDIKRTLGERKDLKPEERKELESFLGKTSKVLDESEKMTMKPSPKLINPAQKQHEENVRKEGLTGTHNSNNPDHPIPAKGTSAGSIGGVGSQADVIEGLFDSIDELFEDEHVFFIPEKYGKTIPFSQDQLRQILRELAIGVYTHGSVPFFSLHFNQKGDLYPIIHPFYENTLVGKVISMLDYIMKGFLNGGTFEESLIYDWHKNPNNNSNSAWDRLIDFEKYCKENLKGKDQSYISLRVMEQATKHPNESKEPEIFRDFTKFNNSFRIIAKQNSFPKEGNLLSVDGDFDVFYTIEPHSDYQEALDQFVKAKGHFPSAYLRMQQCFDEAKRQIHDHMPKLPLCTEYFSMLNLINYISCYYTTLKKHRKIPVLPPLQIKDTKGSPALFPSLPVKDFQEVEYKINLQQVVERLVQNPSYELLNYLAQDGNIPDFQIKAVKLIESAIIDNLRSLASPSEKTLFENNRDKFQSYCSNLAASLLANMKSRYGKYRSGIVNTPLANYVPFGLISQEKWNLFSEEKKFDFLVRDSFVQENWDTVSKNPNYQKNPNEILGHRLFCAKIYLSKCLLMNAPYNEQKIKIAFQPIELKPKESSDKEGVKVGVVGGCGVTMKSQAVVPFAQGEHLLEQIWPDLSLVAPETWIDVSKISKNHKGAAFRLEFEDLAAWEDEDYSWMESILVQENSKEEDYAQDMMAILNAISSGNQPAFNDLINKLPLSQLQRMRKLMGQGLLHIAATDSDVFFLESLLKKGLSANCPDNKGYLPVHYAAMSGSLAKVQLLLNNYPQGIYATSTNGASPIIVAIQHGHKHILKELQCRSGDIKILLANGYTTLHCALHHGHIEVALEVLRDPYFDLVNFQTKDGVSCLMLGCELDSMPLLYAMLDKGADVQLKSQNGTTALGITVNRNSVEACKLLLLRKAQLTRKAIETALEKGSLEMIQLLATQSDFIKYRSHGGDTALMVLMRNGNLPAVLHILTVSKPDYEFLNCENTSKETAVTLAMKGRMFELTRVLQKCGALIGGPEFYKVLWGLEYSDFVDDCVTNFSIPQNELQEGVRTAARLGHCEVLTLLKNKGINLQEFKFDNGWNIIHYLAKFDGIYLFNQFTHIDGDWLQPNPEGKTLAYLAAENGSHRVLNKILYRMRSKNMSVEKHFKERHLLYGAIDNCHEKCVDLLFELEKNPNIALDTDQTRGVHLACKRNSPSILALLHKKGANLSLEDKFGNSPLCYAIRSGSWDCFSFLLTQKVPIAAEAFYFAAEIDDPVFLKALIKAGGKIDIQSMHTGNTAVLQAISQHNTEALSKLLPFKPSFDVVNKEGWAPFLHASATGQVDMLKLIPPSLKEHNGNSALHVACMSGHASCVTLLKGMGFPTEACNKNGQSSRALANGNLSVLAALGCAPTSYTTAIAEFKDALIQQDISALTSLAKELPPNELIEVISEKLSVTATPLQLLIHFCAGSSEKEQVQRLIEALLANPELNLNIQDSEGNTLGHLLPRVEISPVKVNEKRIESWLTDGLLSEEERIVKTLIGIRDYFHYYSNVGWRSEFKFDFLPEGIKNKIYEQVWSLAGKPTPNYSEYNLQQRPDLICNAINSFEAVRQAEQLRYNKGKGGEDFATKLIRIRNFLLYASKEEILTELPGIKKDFDLLPQSIREQMYLQIWNLANQKSDDPRFGENNLFQDIDRFCRAVATLKIVQNEIPRRFLNDGNKFIEHDDERLVRIRDFLRDATPEQIEKEKGGISLDLLKVRCRDKLYEQIWRLADKPLKEDDPNFGENNVLKDIPRFCRAVSSLDSVKQHEKLRFQNKSGKDPYLTLLRLRDFIKNTSQEEFNKELPSIQKDFDLLPLEIRNEVYKQIWVAFNPPLSDLNFGQNNLFKDRIVFCRAIASLPRVGSLESQRSFSCSEEVFSPIKTLSSKIHYCLNNPLIHPSSKETILRNAFNSLPETIRFKIYKEIWILNNYPTGNDNYGEENVFSKSELFYEAFLKIGLGFSNLDFLINFDEKFKQWLARLPKQRTSELFCPYSGAFITRPIRHWKDKHVAVENLVHLAAMSSKMTQFLINGKYYALRDFVDSTPEELWKFQQTKFDFLKEYLSGINLRVANNQQQTPLHLAAQIKSPNVLTSLIEALEPADLDACDGYGSSPLFSAIAGNNSENLQILLDKGANPNHRDFLNTSPLHIAAQAPGNLSLVKKLTENGARIDQPGGIFQQTPLHSALSMKDDAIGLYLMQKGANCKAKNIRGDTPVHLAVQHGKNNLLRLMANGIGIETNVPDHLGLQPVHLAAMHGQVESLSLLKEDGCDIDAPVKHPKKDTTNSNKNTSVVAPDGDTSRYYKASLQALDALKASVSQGSTPLHYAIEDGNESTHQWLTTNKANPEKVTESGLGALAFAAKNNCKSLLKIYDQHRISRDEKQILPAVVEAIKRDYVDSMVLLYNLGVPIEADIFHGFTGLHLASFTGAIHSTHGLLKMGAIASIPDSRGRTPLELSAANKSASQFRLLLEHEQPDLDRQNEKGETLLHIAANSGNLPHVMLLLYYGASQAIQDDYGFTPLHCASRAGHANVVRVLLACGANYKEKTFIEMTPIELVRTADVATREAIETFIKSSETAQPGETYLHLAIKAKDMPSIKILARVEDADVQDKQGIAPLHLATRSSLTSVIMLLLKEQANINIQDNEGRTPLWIACIENKDPKLVEFLLKCKADPKIPDRSGKRIRDKLNEMNFPQKAKILELLPQ